MKKEDSDITKFSELDRWFKEKWVDISKKKDGKHPPCGRSDADKGKYPKCRPSKRVTKETPKTSGELSSSQKASAVKAKRKVERKKSKPAGSGARKPKMAPALKRKSSYKERFLKISDLTKKAQTFRSEEKFQQLDQLENSPYAYLTFSDVSRLGVYGLSNYNTPNGVYCYKFDNINKLINLDFPFATEKPLIHVFIADYRKILDLSVYGKKTLDQDIEKLKEYYPQIDKTFIDSVVNKYKDVNELIYIDDDINFDNTMPGAIIWALTYNLKKDSNDWARIFKLLGYDGVEDHGYGIIHPSEPAQAVFFPQNGVNLVKVFTIANYSFSKYMKDYEDQGKNNIALNEIDFSLDDLKKRQILKGQTDSVEKLDENNKAEPYGIRDISYILNHLDDPRISKLYFEKLINGNLPYDELIPFASKDKKVAKLIADSNIVVFFENNLHKNYPEFGRKQAEIWAKNSDKKFIDYKLWETYPDLKKIVAQQVFDFDIKVFFENNFYKENLDIAKDKIKEMLDKQDYSYILKFKLWEIYPDLLNSFAEKYIIYFPKEFFEYGMQNYYPEVGKKEAEKILKKNPEIFFNLSLENIYPEIAEPLIERLLRMNDAKFFKLNLHLKEKYAEIGRNIAENLVNLGDESFFHYNLNNIYPDLSIAAAESIAKQQPMVFYKMFSKIKELLGDSEANRIMKDSKGRTATLKQKRFKKIARYLRLSKIE